MSAMDGKDAIMDARIASSLSLLMRTWIRSPAGFVFTGSPNRFRVSPDCQQLSVTDLEWNVHRDRSRSASQWPMHSYKHHTRGVSFFLPVSFGGQSHEQEKITT